VLTLLLFHDGDDDRRTDQFRRVRVGVGRPSDKTADLADFVLAKFSREEQKVLDQVAEKAIDDLLASLFPSGFEAKEQTLGG
jgi:peptidyl-tRNA hydrolase